MIGLALLLAASLPPDDGTPLSPADLPAYRAALAPSAEAEAPPVTSRDLWDHPETYRGRRVRVAGRVARRFRQPPLGDFPALAELWLVSPQGDLLCLVYPEPTGQSAPPLGDSVRFVGSFLKRIRYRGEDTDRVAPLIVGARPPASIPAPDPWPPWIPWALALVLAGLVVAILAGRHQERPRPRPSPGPAPEWIGPSTEDETPP